MLDPWFRRAYPLKHAKKWLYWQLCERLVLRDAAAVLFTCEEERRLARRSFSPYTCRERVVAYGTAAPEGHPASQVRAWREFTPELGDRPFWLFLGRIHPKKGVDLLIRAYGELARSAPETLPALVLAGPCADPAFRRTLGELAAHLPATCRVLQPGMLEGDRKWGALRAAEAFVLPSHQENFGIAVAEALAVGTPVLISKKVNIWSEIESRHAGYAEGDNADGTLRLLRRWRVTSREKRNHMKAAARALFHERYEITRVARSLVQTIAPFVAATTAPDAVSHGIYANS
jgi:glycosyltransferase involved in cell wall biosynthesis